jgi:hypothetical protein
VRDALPLEKLHETGFLKRKNMKNELHYDRLGALESGFLLAEKAKKDTMAP